MPDLADLTRATYRDAFAQALARQEKHPLIIPFSLLGPFILPTLWLAIPHARRPWVYRTRWVVVFVVLAFNLNLIRSTSSGNVACAYGAGLMATFGILSTLLLLVWSNPQLEAARAVRVRRSKPEGATNGHSTGANGAVNGNGLKHRTSPKEDGHPGQADGGSEEEYVWVWQPFPEEAPFPQRLNWAFDLATSFRGVGWNWSIPSVPSPEIPTTVRAGDPVILDAMPRVSPSGYRRCLSESEFVGRRLGTVAIMYILLDFLAVFMVKDPYFVFGPGHGYSLPSYLQGIPEWLLVSYRELFTLAGIYAAIEAVFNLHDLVQYYLVSHIIPSRGHLWQYSSIFGSMSQVLDRGLAGWWGSWWHQTFRLQFMAPAMYLIRRGYLSEGSAEAKVVTIYTAFLHSGFLHASGSTSSMHNTKLWRSPVFFLLQGTGIFLQQGVVSVLKKQFPKIPQVALQAYNLVFTVAWLQVTSRLFVDDIASAGIWLLEPVPASFFRFMGFGHPDDHWWRWTREQFPTWYFGGPWWETGIAM